MNRHTRTYKDIHSHVWYTDMRHTQWHGHCVVRERNKRHKLTHTDRQTDAIAPEVCGATFVWIANMGKTDASSIFNN